jgi:7-carboxy-7-deazaguanine synthase (Cx14CxxC type)
MFVVKEIFYTLQGEGFHSGRAAVFCRFAGCNLWNGKEEDRKNAECNFCDTDFVGGEKYNKYQLVLKCNTIFAATNKSKIKKFVVLTGGEPMLQVTEELVEEFHSFNFEVAIETNGTLDCPSNIDWICVSPKKEDLKQKIGDELKLVYPQKINPKLFEKLNFKHFYLQPKDNEDLKVNEQLCINYCLDNPMWQLSTQTHKFLGLQ